MRALVTVSACALLVSLAACDDDDAPASGDLSGPDHQTATDRGPGGGDRGSRDGAAGSPDSKPAADRGPTDAIIVKSNSGAICTTTNPTCQGAGEECIYFEVSTGKGMCLGRCNQQGDLCPVANTATQMSVCSVTGMTAGRWYCGWFCELGGKTYLCPNSTAYKCVADSTGKAKFCQPK